MNRRSLLSNGFLAFLFGRSTKAEMSTLAQSARFVKGESLRTLTMTLDKKFIEESVAQTMQKITRQIVIQNGVPQMILGFPSDDIDMTGDCAGTG